MAQVCDGWMSLVLLKRDIVVVWYGEMDWLGKTGARFIGGGVVVWYGEMDWLGKTGARFIGGGVVVVCVVVI
jgi:hypothetical protein